MILKSAKSEVTGILNIGTLPKTVFEFASKRNKNIIPIKKDTNTNFSLNTSKYEKLFNNK
jgi:hypothetical protein